MKKENKAKEKEKTDEDLVTDKVKEKGWLLVFCTAVLV